LKLDKKLSCFILVTSIGLAGIVVAFIPFGLLPMLAVLAIYGITVRTAYNLITGVCLKPKGLGLVACVIGLSAIILAIIVIVLSYMLFSSAHVSMGGRLGGG